MTDKLHVLIVEDSGDDAALCLRELRKGGFEPLLKRVDTPEGFLCALNEGDWDIVISDFAMPRFNGLTALKMLKEFDTNIPFILVSGAVGEEVAVDVMRAGAGDYVMKENLTRLVPAVRRELDEARVRHERRKAEEALYESQERYRKLFENANDIVITADLGGRVQTINPAAKRILGYEPEELMGDRFISLISEESFKYVKKHISRKNTGEEERATYEVQVYGKDGRLVDVEISSWLVRDREKNPVGIHAIIRDLTERKDAEAKLIKSERKLKKAQRIAHIGSWEWDIAANKELWSDETYRIFGLEPGDTEISHEMFLRFVHPDDRDKVIQSDNDTLSSGAPMDIEHRIVRPDGSVRVLHSHAVLETVKSGKPARLVGVVMDITEQKEAEEHISMLAAVVENTTDIIFITDFVGAVQYVNESFERITGHRKTDIIGKRLDNVLKENLEGDAMTIDVKDTVDKGKIGSGRFTGKRDDGKVFYAEMTIFPIHGHGGRVMHHVASLRDITHEVTLERQFLQAQKMEALGTLAGGIAHDFNNILFSILGYSTLALKESPKDSEQYSSIEAVIRAGQRAKDLVQQILLFSRSRSDRELQPIQAHHIVGEALKLLQVSVPSSIELRRDIITNSDIVLADPTQIHQIVMNLCANAIQAMGENGGVLDVVLKSADIGESSPEIEQGVRPGSYVLLSVTDTGHGIQPEILDKIFDPFFTTKDVGAGTGLGLAAVHGIVTRHKGAIVVESEVGKGASFNVYLPRVNIKPNHAVENDSPARGGDETVLVVDNDEDIARLLKNTLEDAGYKVVAETSGVKALEKFIEKPDSFDLVITDLSMPQITGEALTQAVVKIRKNIPVIIMTGYGETTTKEKAVAAGARELIIKPVAYDDLLGMVRDILDSGA